MNHQHTFHLHLNWERQNPIKGNSSKIYTKSHQISIPNKEILDISAAKVFKGDPTLYNPEDLLLSSLTSCHMMSYLYVCNQEQIEILSYQDHSEAILEVQSDGSGKITQVNLNPVIEIQDSSQKEMAISLHQKANELCFIANSCNFPIYHHVTIKTAENQ